MAGAPGWHVVRRTGTVISGYPTRWVRHFWLPAVAVAVGLVVLVLVLTMVRAHWSEDLSRATGIAVADRELRDEVRALEEANARLSAELTRARTRQSVLENARKLADSRIAELTAALDAAHREAARLEGEHARLRREIVQPSQSVTRARAPSAMPQQPAPEPASDANAGQPPDSAAGAAMVVSGPAAARTAAPEAAAPSMVGPNAPIEEPDFRQDPVATVTLQTKSHPVLPDRVALLPRPRPRADAPSMTRSQGGIGALRSRTQEPGTGSIQPSRWSPQVGADPASLGSAAMLQVAGEASTLDDRSALAAGGIRVFIHHVANRQGDAALAQRLTDYLRRQGFTVAEIRPVDLNIGTPSVRYFFQRDRAASQRVVEELGRFFDEGTSLAPDHASDFTHFLPKPPPGNVEVWLPASSG